MNTVEPLRDSNIIQDFEDYFKVKNERDYVLFVAGIYLGRRISDILQLKVRDVRNRDYIYMREKKTGKEARVAINKDLKKIFKDYTKDKKDYEFLFSSREGKNKPISRQRAYQILNEAADFFSITDPIGCHTLRKTFGYWIYKKSKDIEALREMYNHSDNSVTRHYIGITQDTKDKLVNDLSFK